MRPYRRYPCGQPEAEPFAPAIEAMDEHAWDRAVDLFGPRISRLDPGLDRQVQSVRPDEIVALAA